MHVLHQVTGQRAGAQRVLLFDKGPLGGIGQVLDRLAAQDRQLSPTRVLRAQLPVSLG